MLEQIWNEDQKIRDGVIYAYKELYLKQTRVDTNQAA